MERRLHLSMGFIRISLCTRRYVVDLKVPCKELQLRRPLKLCFEPSPIFFAFVNYFEQVPRKFEVTDNCAHI